ncbi:hypothetical protein BGZ76_003254 [Entomortierella beljakovae]|nr:hypothetical protein BGZ76_003254 [Entomortierella beljakovae]
MTTDWDPSRDYDSQTFSEDYNLHGASARSFDHPSVTRDHINIFDILDGKHDDYSIDNADMGLIAEIVEGKTSHQRAPPRRKPHQPDENSESSMMRYLINGSQELLDQYESPEAPPMRYSGAQIDRQRLFTDDGNDDRIQETLPGTPRRQTRVSDQRLTPKISPVMRRSLLPVRQHLDNSPKAGRRVRSLSIDKGFKSPALRFGTPSRHGSGSGSGIPKPLTRQESGPSSGIPKASALPRKVSADSVQPKKNVAVEPPIKPIFRSALKSANNNGVNGDGQLPKSKLVRHIQLPTEILNSDDDSEEPVVGSNSDNEANQCELKASEESGNHINQLEEPEEPEEIEDPRIQNEGGQSQDYEKVNDQGQEQDRSQGHSIGLVAGLDDVLGDGLSSRIVSNIPGPPRFTRITKKMASPGKKLIATIPTPLDDSNEQVLKTIKELKDMLGRVGLLPLSSTLETSLDELDSTTMEKGGLCETVNLILKLGGMYEKQKEVIHQMTDQLISNETQTEKNSESNEKIEELTHELQDAKIEQNRLKVSNQELTAKSAIMTVELQKLREAEVVKTQSTEPPRDKLLVDAESQVSGNWENIEELMDRGLDESLTMRSRKPPQQPEASSAFWRAHIQKIEKELQELKAKLDKYQTSSSSRSVVDNTEDLEEKISEILLDNRRLMQKNKSLTKELLKAQGSDSADEKRIRDSRYKSILKGVMARLGVDQEQSILPALKEIERVVRDIPNLRRFVTKAERIIWESEILEGTVKVQKYSRSNPKGIEPDLDSQGYSNSRDGGEPTIKVGRTCSQSYDDSLQRLKEWSELLDVLNHVEFAENTEDEDEEVNDT